MDGAPRLERPFRPRYPEDPWPAPSASESSRSSTTAWPGVTHPTSSGGLGFSHKWNLGWMHDSLGYMSLDPVYRRHHHNENALRLLDRAALDARASEV